MPLFPILIALATVVSGFAQNAAQASESAGVVKKFNDAVTAYVKLRDAQKTGEASQKQSSSPEKVVAQQRALAKKIRRARTGVGQGNIFSSDVAASIRSQIAAVLKGDEGKKIIQSLRHAEPVHGLKVGANKRYPANVPLQSMPPALLESLPHLPAGMEYRLVDNTLLLYDSECNLIVDFMKHALPE